MVQWPGNLHPHLAIKVNWLQVLWLFQEAWHPADMSWLSNWLSLE